MSDTSNDSSPAARIASFADEVRGQQPHSIDRELSTLLQDNYVVSDLRRGLAEEGAPELPASWARMDEDDVRAAGLDPALMHDAKSGFDASFYKDAQGHVVLAFTGTDEGRDWKHNFGQGLGLKDDQYDRALTLGRKAREAFGEDIIFTGHSLGGGLAAAAGMANDVPVVTFNAAGVHDKTLERHGFDADVLKREAEQGLIRSYRVDNEILTHLQEDSIPLKWAMPDAPGHEIVLPDPDPLSFFERLVPGKMLMHRVDLHFIEAVMEAQDLAQLQARERNPVIAPRAIGDVDGTSNRLLRDAAAGLAPRREPLGLAENERFLNTVASMAARARLDGLSRIDHVATSADAQRIFAVQGDLHDPAHRRSQVDLEQAVQAQARQSAMQLRANDIQQQEQAQMQERQQRAALAF
ncbi:XVIPCD domain-containing protein [Luteimonas soli]|uniref:XVIPCD domain-containing protein n=1 Tax=Luteimonas soli TaxID=1648966 RepID=A0ABV7XLW0_9GAMM